MASLKYNTAEELEEKIHEYFEDCKTREKVMTYTGFAYALGFLSRQSIWEYSKRKDEFSLPIKRAMLRIEQDYEERLASGSPAGAIFALKNRGWSDKQEIEHSGETTHTIKSWGEVMGGDGPETEQA